jgi:hypothetical protein
LAAFCILGLLYSCHCERSEAIQQKAKSGLLGCMALTGQQLPGT